MKRGTYFSWWQCTTCGRRYKRDEVLYLCPSCSVDYQPGIPLPGVLEAVFDYQEIGRTLSQKGRENFGLEEFCQLFSALERKLYPPLPVGNTPFYKLKRIGREDDNIWIKNEALNPSASFKDRASHLMVAEARRLGVTEIACASTGNAASSLAAFCASAGIKAVIFAPASAPPAKLVQIKIHGAELHLVNGSYDDAFKAALEYSSRQGCLNRNTAYHPLTIEGKKSSGLELYHQNSCKSPDWIVIPVGDGVILAGIHKAFLDLKRSGQLVRLPRLLAVQAASSDAITSYWETGEYNDAQQPATIADSISVRTPSNAHWALRALRDTEGAALRVSDEEISDAQAELASCAGVFSEPSSAAALAGMHKAMQDGLIASGQQVVLLITGHGLKDINSVKTD